MAAPSGLPLPIELQIRVLESMRSYPDLQLAGESAPSEIVTIADGFMFCSNGVPALEGHSQGDRHQKEERVSQQTYRRLRHAHEANQGV